MRRRLDLVFWPLLFLCLNGCYGPTQTLRGQVERLPESASVAASGVSAGAPTGMSSRLSDDELLRLARENRDPVSWAEQAFAAGRPDLTPSHLIGLHRLGIPPAHLDALYAREMRAREADAADRVADREKQLARAYDEDLRRFERARPVAPVLPYGPGYPFMYGVPYPGAYPGLPYYWH